MPNKSLTRIEGILMFYTRALGNDYNAYRNHVYRVYHLTLLQYQGNPSNQQLDTLAIACAFHDLAIWTHDSMDYLENSVSLAENYLEDVGLADNGVADLIRNHHKLSEYLGPNQSLAEAFRRSDTTDLSMGLLRYGLSYKLYKNLKQDFPMLGFHKMMIGKTINYALRNPKAPFPMLKR